MSVYRPNIDVCPSDPHIFSTRAPGSHIIYGSAKSFWEGQYHLFSALCNSCFAEIFLFFVILFRFSWHMGNRQFDSCGWHVYMYRGWFLSTVTHLCTVSPSWSTRRADSWRLLVKHLRNAYLQHGRHDGRRFQLTLNASDLNEKKEAAADWCAA